MRWRLCDDRPIDEEDLSAFSDGRLPPARTARVAAHLRRHPEDADRIHAYWQREARLLSALDADGLACAASTREAVTRPARRHRRALATAFVAGLLALTAGSLSLWRGASQSLVEDRSWFVTAALDAYARAGDEAGAAEGRLVREVGRVDAAPMADLADPFLQPMRDAMGRSRIELGTDGGAASRYLGGSEFAPIASQTSAGGPELRVFERGDLRLVEWTFGGRRYAVVGEGSTAELTRLAVQVRSEMLADPAGLTETPLIGVPTPDAVVLQ